MCHCRPPEKCLLFYWQGQDSHLSDIFGISCGYIRNALGGNTPLLRPAASRFSLNTYVFFLKIFTTTCYQNISDQWYQQHIQWRQWKEPLCGTENRDSNVFLVLVRWISAWLILFLFTCRILMQILAQNLFTFCIEIHLYFTLDYITYLRRNISSYVQKF